MPLLDIDEEYGYGRWVADLTDAEYKQLLERWATIRGMNCLVPVPFIVPQAKRVQGVGEESCWAVRFPEGTLRAHFHECDDSFIEGSDYEIPETGDGTFWMDGVHYSHEDLVKMLNEFRASEERLNNT